MDPLTRAFYEMTFKLRFLECRGEAFQDLFSTILEKRYPRGDFQRVRPWGSDGDRKNDGYLRSKRTLFQCYAPDALRAAELAAKVREDLRGARKYWKKYFDTWVFVHNDAGGLGARVATELLAHEVKQSPFKLEQWGRDALLEIVRELSEQDLADIFGPVPSRRDVVALAMADLFPVLDHLARLPPTGEQDVRPVPADKLRRNSLSDSVATLIQAGMSRTGLVKLYFRDRPMEQDRIAGGFRARYASLRDEGTPPDDIFGELQRHACGTTPAPSRQVASLAVLAFFFETCEIFERPDPSEATP